MARSKISIFIEEFNRSFDLGKASLAADLSIKKAAGIMRRKPHLGDKMLADATDALSFYDYIPPTIVKATLLKVLLGPDTQDTSKVGAAKLLGEMLAETGDSTEAVQDIIAALRGGELPERQTEGSSD